MSESRTLYWAITGYCQLRCHYCFYQTGVVKRISRNVSLDDIDRIIPAIRKTFSKVTLTGGEPLLHPGFDKIVRKLRKSDLDVELLTDGILLTDDIAHFLDRQGVHRVGVSLDSLVTKSNKCLRMPSRQSVSNTERTISNLQSFSKQRHEGLDIAVLQTVTRANTKDILPMVSFCKELGIDLLVHPADYPDTDLYREHSWKLASEQEIEVLRNNMFFWAGNNTFRQRYVEMAVALVNGIPLSNVSCDMGKKSFYLGVDGILYPCFHRLDWPLANVMTDNLDDAVNRSRFVPLKDSPCSRLCCACMLE